MHSWTCLSRCHSSQGFRFSGGMATLAVAKLWAAASSTRKVPSVPLHATVHGTLLHRPSRAHLQWISRVPARSIKPMTCSNMLSDGSNHDEEYVNSTVLEAVEVKSGSEGFLIKMRDGRYIKCVHNNPDGGRLPDYAPQPAIVLKVEDGSDLLLPIIVLELPATMLMETVRNVHIVRPTIYQVLKDLIELMGFKAKLVRVTKRVQEAYYAQLILFKQVGDEVQEVCLDLRPSDAINVAARCQVPIQVNRHLAYGDGVRVVNDPAKIHTHSSSSSRLQGSSGGLSLFTELDRPQTDQTSTIEAEEFVLVRSMLMAAAEERYIDAARIRDELKELRLKEGN